MSHRWCQKLLKPSNRQELEVERDFRNDDTLDRLDRDALLARLELEEEDSFVVAQRDDQAEQVARDDREDAVRVRLDGMDQSKSRKRGSNCVTSVTRLGDF